jgi:ferric-dicitrate binding protein FerR (iron transport regulator)
MNEYLWDRGGRDTEVERLEHLLARYRAEERPFVLPHSLAESRKWYWPAFSLAAAVVLIAITASILFWTAQAPKDRITATVLEGSLRINNVAKAKGTVSVNERIETGPHDRARVQVAEIGLVEIEPSSVFTLLESRADRRRFRLDRGEVRVRISAPPAVFVIETPAARAIDLGCAYRLRIAPGGEGTIDVSDGWVEMDRGFEQTLVPAGAAAAFFADRISPAYMQDTNPVFRDAMLEWWRSEDLPVRRATLARAVSSATRQDAFTLLNMLHHALSEERRTIYDRLEGFVPAPPEVSRAAVLAGSPNAAEAWWPVIEHELGLSAIKKKSPLRLDRYWPQ